MVLSSSASNQTTVSTCLVCNITRSMTRSRASCLVMISSIISGDGGVEVIVVDVEVFCFTHF